MKYILFILPLFLFACKTTRTVSRTDEQVTTQRKDSVQVQQHVDTHTEEYNDTLRTNSYVPLPTAPSTGSGAVGEIVQAESKGVKVTAVITPRRDTAGRVTGSDVTLTAIAKPTTTTDTHAETNTSATHQQDKQSEVQQSVKQKEKPFALIPVWAWIAAGVVALYFAYRAIKKFILKIP